MDFYLKPSKLYYFFANLIVLFVGYLLGMVAINLFMDRLPLDIAETIGFMIGMTVFVLSQTFDLEETYAIHFFDDYIEGASDRGLIRIPLMEIDWPRTRNRSLFDKVTMQYPVWSIDNKKIIVNCFLFQFKQIEELTRKLEEVERMLIKQQ